MLCETLLHGTHEKIECFIETLSLSLYFFSSSDNLITAYYMLVFTFLYFFHVIISIHCQFQRLQPLWVCSDLFGENISEMTTTYNNMKFSINFELADDIKTKMFEKKPKQILYSMIHTALVTHYVSVYLVSKHFPNILCIHCIKYNFYLGTTST